jgi:L-iditol 2-dehydrogenase
MTFGTPETCERLLVKAPFEFRRERVPLPDSWNADYLVRVDVCGLCRSDLHAAADWARDWQEVGHEFGGTIVAARRPDGLFSVGDRVAVRNAADCGECAACLAGNSRSCQRLIVNMQGFRDYALCHERSLVDASGLDDDLLSLVEPTNVALDLLHAANIDSTHRLAVLGSGTLGLLTAYLARHVWAVTEIVMVGRTPASPLAETFGASAYRSFEQMETPRYHADRVLVTTPPSTMDAALRLCRHGGWIVTVGLDDTDRCTIAVDISQLIFGQQTLRGLCAAPNAHFVQAVSALRQHGRVLRQLIGRRTPRTGLEGALRGWQDRAHFEGKTIILRGGETPQ